MRCLTLALENPAKEGEYRTFNQFAEVYNVTELAEMVQRVAQELGLSVEIKPIENPRIEDEEHHYAPIHQKLKDLGYQPSLDLETEMRSTLSDLIQYQDRIHQHRNALFPDIRWKGARRKSDYLPS